MNLKTSLKTNLSDIAQLLHDHDRVLILSHVRPDGDALGSQLALGAALIALGKTVTLWNEGPIPQTLHFLPNFTQHDSPKEGTALDVDLVIALDTANRERLGASCLAAINSYQHWITIDHHVSNEGYGDFIHIDEKAPATGEIIYNLLTQTNLPFPEEAVENLYVAISTDTGSFQYSSTTAHTYEIGADLIRRGLDLARVNQLTYMNHGIRRVELLRELLQTFQISEDGKIADCQLTMATKNELSLQVDDGEGLIDVLRGINTVLVAVWFEELKDGFIRVSMRSKDPRANVSEIGAHFGGGGHILAAGIRMAGPLATARQQVLAKINEATANISI